MTRHSGFSWRTTRRRASVLILVLSVSMVMLVMLLGLAYFVLDMNRLTRIKWSNDQAQYAASAGLAHLFAYLQSLPNAPTLTGRTEIEATPDGHRVSLPAGCSYRLFLSPAAGSTSGNRRYLMESVATMTDPRLNKLVHCRATMQVTQESFAKYEQFVNFAPVWSGSSTLVDFQDFGTIGLGPIHCNSGANIFSSCLFAKPVTSSATGVNTFNDLWAMYYWVRNNRPASQNTINVAGPYTPHYTNPTVFYGGLSVNEPTISIPGIGNELEDRTRAIRESAQLKFPSGDPDPTAASAGVKAAAYPEGTGGKYMYVLEFSDPSATNGDGQVVVKQYTGWNNTTDKQATYRTVGTYNLNADGQGILVDGDIIGLRGTIDGRCTVAAFNDPDTPQGGGDIYITGQLQYESRVNNAGFEFPDRNQMAVGGQLNEAYYAQLESQVSGLNDILGIVADGNVLVPEGAESGGAAAFRTNAANNSTPVYGNFASGTVTNICANGTAASPSLKPPDNGQTPFYVDGIVMSTGYNGSDKTFQAVNAHYRRHGWMHTLGGIITLQSGQWNLFTGTTWTGGIQRYKYWDMRMSDPTLAPPYFPLTGNWTVVDDTWDMQFVNTETGE